MTEFGLTLVILALDYYITGLLPYIVHEMKVSFSKDGYYVNIRKCRRGLSLRDRSKDLENLNRR